MSGIGKLERSVARNPGSLAQRAVASKRERSVFPLGVFRLARKKRRIAILCGVGERLLLPYERGWVIHRSECS